MGFFFFFLHFEAGLRRGTFKQHTSHFSWCHYEAAPLVSQAAVLLSEAKVNLKASLSISIKKRLHWHQRSATFLIPPVRRPPPLTAASSSPHTPRSEPAHPIIPQAPTIPNPPSSPTLPASSHLSFCKLLMQGKTGAAPVQLWFSCVFMFASGCKARAICIRREKKERKKKKNTRFAHATWLHRDEEEVLQMTRLAFETDSDWLTSISKDSGGLGWGWGDSLFLGF